MGPGLRSPQVPLYAFLLSGPTLAGLSALFEARGTETCSISCLLLTGSFRSCPSRCAGSHLRDLFNQFPMLVDQLINIANYIPEGRVKRFDLTRTGGLGHVTRMNPTEVILPVLETLTPELPPEGAADQDHNAYIGREITITSINKEVRTLLPMPPPLLLGVAGGADDDAWEPVAIGRGDAEPSEAEEDHLQGQQYGLAHVPSQAQGRPSQGPAPHGDGDRAEPVRWRQ